MSARQPMFVAFGSPTPATWEDMTDAELTATLRAVLDECDRRGVARGSDRLLPLSGPCLMPHAREPHLVCEHALGHRGMHCMGERSWLFEPLPDPTYGGFETP